MMTKTANTRQPGARESRINAIRLAAGIRLPAAALIAILAVAALVSGGCALDSAAESAERNYQATMSDLQAARDDLAAATGAIHALEAALADAKAALAAAADGDKQALMSAIERIGEQLKTAYAARDAAEKLAADVSAAAVAARDRVDAEPDTASKIGGWIGAAGAALLSVLLGYYGIRQRAGRREDSAALEMLAGFTRTENGVRARVAAAAAAVPGADRLAARISTAGKRSNHGGPVMATTIPARRE